MAQGLERLGPDRGQHDPLHPQILAAGRTGLSGAAIDEHPVASRREPLADLFHARLEAAIGCRHTAGAQHSQAHFARIDGGPAHRGSRRNFSGRPPLYQAGGGAKLCFLALAGLWLTSCARPGTATAPSIDWLKQVQPFVNRPAPAYTPPTLGPSPFPTSAPPCQGSQLRAVGAPGGVGMGNIRYEVNFTNVSQVTCQLNGVPQVQGLDSAGRLVAVPMTIGTYFLDPIPADVA